jgi:ABC-type uncharacterized transport system auxiliary subunit
MNSRRFATAASIAALATIFAITGCLSRVAPPTRTYAFSPADAPPRQFVNSQVLAMRALKVASPFDGRAFVYRIGDTSYIRDPYAEFLDPPTNEIASPLRERLRGGGNFLAVEEPGSVVKPNVLSEVSVTELYGDFRKPDRPAAVFTIRFVFIDAPNGIPGTIFLAREYSRNEPLNERTASALMDAWNRELEEILAEVNTELADNLAARSNNQDAKEK